MKSDRLLIAYKFHKRQLNVEITEEVLRIRITKPTAH